MELTAFEKFTARFAPKWTRNRVAARMALRNFEAARGGYRTQGWARTNGDADNVSIRALPDLRMHARDLIRNNAWAKRGQRIIANNTVGTGIVPKASHKLPAVAQKAADLWKAWAESVECESENRMTFYGLQSLVMKSIYESGEVLIRKRPRRVVDDLTIPLQLQVLEADFLDLARNALSSDSGGPIIAGVEFDALGKRAAYWIFAEHPGSGRNKTPSYRVDADDIIHLFYLERPGQTRGISWLAASIVNLKDFDAYEDAELMKQKIAACFAIFVQDPTGDPGVSLGSIGTTSTKRIESVEPGAINYLDPGQTVEFGNPPVLTSEDFTKRILRRIAAALNIPAEELTGDYSQVNYSSARMARLSHMQAVIDWQWNMIVPLLCQRVWSWAMYAAQLDGEIPAGDLPTAVWTAPPLPMIDPDKETNAAIKSVRGGLKTLSQALREQGEDPDQVFEERAKDDAKLDSLKITVDSDPRKVTTQGMEQVSVSADAAPDEPAKSVAKTPPPRKA